jgi:hypothetical protein
MSGHQRPALFTGYVRTAQCKMPVSGQPSGSAGLFPARRRQMQNRSHP